MEIIYIVCFLVWNVFKLIGVFLMWCWSLGNRTPGELFEGPNSGFTGVLTLAISAMSWFVISGWGTNY